MLYVMAAARTVSPHDSVWGHGRHSAVKSGVSIMMTESAGGYKTVFWIPTPDANDVHILKQL